jgi:cytochrome c oxidase assembly factor CtaG
MRALVPAGLVQLRRGFLVKVVVLYAIAVLLVLAIPAVVTQRRAEAPHPIQQQARQLTPAAHADTDLPRRTR